MRRRYLSTGEEQQDRSPVPGRQSAVVVPWGASHVHRNAAHQGVGPCGGAGLAGAVRTREQLVSLTEEELLAMVVEDFLRALGHEHEECDVCRRCVGLEHVCEPPPFCIGLRHHYLWKVARSKREVGGKGAKPQTV